MSAKSMSGRWIPRPVLVALVLACIGATTSGAAFSPVAAQVQRPTGPAEDAGSVEVVAADDPGRLLSGGGSAAEFTLRPPADATCPGDSALDNWRISSFVIPADDDPGQLVIGPFAPEGEGQWPLYLATTSAYINEALEQNFVAGEPARLLPVPALSFGVFPTDVLVPGRYTIGLVCSQWKVSAKYWDIDIVVVADPEDEPGGFRWSVVDAPADAVAADAGGGSSTVWWLVGGGAAIAVVAVFLRPRGRTNSTVDAVPIGETRTKEPV